MTVDRTAKAEDESVMSIHFAQQGSADDDSPTSAPNPVSSTTTTSTTADSTPVGRVQTIDMKHRTNSEILQELIRVTKAYPIEATAEEQEEIRLLEEQRLRSQRDSAKSAEVRARVKREKELLEQARGDMAGQAA